VYDRGSKNGLCFEIASPFHDQVFQSTTMMGLTTRKSGVR
jgi:hypothetical protein